MASKPKWLGCEVMWGSEEVRKPNTVRVSNGLSGATVGQVGGGAAVTGGDAERKASEVGLRVSAYVESQDTRWTPRPGLTALKASANSTPGTVPLCRCGLARPSRLGNDPGSRPAYPRTRCSGRVPRGRRAFRRRPEYSDLGVSRSGYVLRREAPRLCRSQMLHQGEPRRKSMGKRPRCLTTWRGRVPRGPRAVGLSSFPPVVDTTWTLGRVWGPRRAAK
jgi:hypothetical protein